MICACEIRTFLSVKQKVLKKCQRFVLVPQPKSCFGPNRLNWSLSAWQIIYPGHGYLPCPWMALSRLLWYDMQVKYVLPTIVPVATSTFSKLAYLVCWKLPRPAAFFSFFFPSFFFLYPQTLPNTGHGRPVSTVSENFQPSVLVSQVRGRLCTIILIKVWEGLPRIALCDFLLRVGLLSLPLQLFQ